ncbi:MAG: L,D-transpeptidase family protein [Candidatus Pseudobacter hemicellulosilyticus]|uniref:L,D-transpeptidase family protein n=1 Tax=Candidatus Pseudobacter hemicellulosilyticus TaxID=3121375 RepID=A0AAJ6BGW2_9BACT|nr:MAG: L,D-transpeptidase family protein [Pseudobacter sp.]
MHKNAGRISYLSFFVLLFISCGQEAPKEKDIVEEPAAFEVRLADNIRSAMAYVLDNKGRLNDTVVLTENELVGRFYKDRDHQSLWCGRETWSPAGDALFSFIANSREYGLFPSDYHFRALSGIRQQIAMDSIARKNAALWSRGDILLTDAAVLLSKHLKRGHFSQDSISLKIDSALGEDFYLQVVGKLQQSANPALTFGELEPRQAGYDSLKAGLRYFLDSIRTFRRYTVLPFPVQDSVGFYKLLQRRLFEDDLLTSATEPLDTAAWRSVLGNYQQTKGLKVTGKINENTVASLNNTDWEKFKRVSITLDRYKLMTDTLPETYIWVNIPAYMLQVRDADSIALESRVIVGQSKTRTPYITSNVTNFITYPQWTVPYSIIFKEMIPKIRQNVDYLRKENLMVVDRNDSIIDPYTLNWEKLGKNNFPYLLKQRQGDDNSLGVLKFNFPNTHSVYLHDTNARWLFSRSGRALSHGCVRVKEFMKLADFLVRNDTIRYHPDTLRNWIKRQEKHTVSGFTRVPIYIRYFSCEGKNGKLKIYEDIYGEDKLLKERYFADKAIL